MVKVHGSCVNHSITSKASRKLRFDSLNIWQKNIVIIGARRNKKQERSNVSLECFREWLNYSLKKIFNIFLDIIKKKEKKDRLESKGARKNAFNQKANLGIYLEHKVKVLCGSKWLLQ